MSVGTSSGCCEVQPVQVLILDSSPELHAAPEPSVPSPEKIPSLLFLVTFFQCLVCRFNYWFNKISLLIHFKWHNSGALSPLTLL
jgi:hypothetical protein